MDERLAAEFHQELGPAHADAPAGGGHHGGDHDVLAAWGAEAGSDAIGLASRSDGSRAQVAPRDQLGDDADRDLDHALRADVQADRCRHPLQVVLGDPLLSQSLEDQADLAAAADQPDVRRWRRRQVIEGLLIVPVPSRHDQGVGPVA